jgi:hypothetical protein
MSEILSMSHVCNNKNNVSNISMKNQPGQMILFLYASLLFRITLDYKRIPCRSFNTNANR